MNEDALFTPHDDGFLSPEELVDALNEGIIQSIKSSGESLPSSAITNPSSSPVQCEWTEYATVSSSSTEEGEGGARGRKPSTFSSPVINDLKQFFPGYLDGSEFGSDGRPMVYAACLGLLLSCGDDSVSTTGDKTPLSTFLSIASFLLNEVGANPNQPTETRGACHRPPLHLVARSCHPAAVRMLIESGAEDSRDDEGWTALMACCMTDIPPADKGGPLDEDRIETLKILLGEIDDPDYVNARNWCGYNALHYACEGLNSTLIKCLLETGRVDATLRTIWGQSCVCLIQSERESNPEEAVKCEALIVDYLEKTGQMADIESFLEEERKMITLMSLANDVLIPASRKPECTADKSSCVRLSGANDQDVRIVTALMKYFGMDPSSLFDEKDDDNISQVNGNIYEELMNRVTDLVPSALRKVYRDQPTQFEREIVVGTDYRIRESAEVFVEGVRHIDTSKVMDQTFHLFRQRGHVAERMAMLTDLLVAPLQRTFSFAIPNEETLKEIVSHAPRICEMGAGTGYWSAMLSRNGADVIAFDVHPGTKQENVYVGKQMYYLVQEGVDSTVFSENNSDTMDRALLMVWPNNPDDFDNPHVKLEGETALPPIWDIDCLQRYYDMGGQTVIYVGEREEKIQLIAEATGSDCGFCGSRKFQHFLWENFDLKAVIECPRWWMKEDDVTVWKRK